MHGIGTALAALCATGGAGDEALARLVDTGALVVVRRTPEGKFLEVAAAVAIRRTADAVFAQVLDFDTHKDFIPRLLESESKSVEPGVIDVTYLVDSPFPFPNQRYTTRWQVDLFARALDGVWIRGDAKGHRKKWQVLDAGPGRSVAFYTASARPVGIVEALDDERQTATVALNVAAAMTVVESFKRRMEGQDAVDGGVVDEPDAGSLPGDAPTAP